MTDKLHEEVSRGDRAKRLIEDELLVEAFTTIRRSVHTAWENSSATANEGREEAWRMLKAVNEVERYLHIVIETGKLARIQLDADEEKKQRGNPLPK